MRKKVRKRFKKAKRTGIWSEYHAILSEYKKAINRPTKAKVRIMEKDFKQPE